MTEILAPTIAPPGQPCAACGSPLAGDQRYCLVCGERRLEARLPFRDVLAIPAPSAPAPAPPPDPRATSRANATLVAGVGCLLLALGIGVLIGRAGRGTAAKVPPAQVIRIQGAAAPTVAAAPTSTTPTKASPTKHHAAAGASHATNKKIQNLQNLSTNAYQKKSQKLPKTVGTGGKPPPKDKKPAAGGGGFQNIG